MTYTTEIEINASIEKVAELLGDHEKMKIWIKELDTYELISGELQQEGAKTRLRLSIGPGGMDAVETVTKIDFPNQFNARYEMEHGSLDVNIRLKPVGENKTRYTLDHNFKFTGFLKVATALMKPAFIAHSERMIQAFKKLAERQ